MARARNRALIAQGKEPILTPQQKRNQEMMAARAIADQRHAEKGGMVVRGGVTPRPVSRPVSRPVYDQYSSSGTPAATPQQGSNSMIGGLFGGLGGGKGGGQPTVPAPTQGQFAQLAPQGGFNVNQAAAGALQQAMQGTQQGLGFEAGPTKVFGYNPAKYRAYTLSKTDIGQYQNPFTEQVIDRTRQDIERQQAGSLNVLGSQAQTAGAFGGGRHGLAEGAMMGEYGRTFGDIAAQQRQAGYDQALQAAQFDIGQRTAAQAANAAARTAARQYRAGARTAAQQQRFANQLAAEQQRMSAASQLAGLGQQAFQTGQTIQQQQAQQGLLQQGLQQALIDAARGQYAGYTGAPSAALQAPLAALGVTPVPQTTTQGYSPGLFDYLKYPLMGLAR